MIRSEKTSLVIPAYEPWRPKEGDQVAIFGLAGDPNDTTTSWKCAWGSRRKPTLGPLFLHGFVDVAPLTESECDKLQDLIGVQITEPAKEKIEIAIQQLTTHVALKAKLPTWKQLGERLQNAIQAANILLNLFDSLPQKVVDGVPSVDQTIGAHVVLALLDFPQERTILEITKRIRTLLDAFKHVSDGTQSTKSKKGPKVDIAFQVFSEAMIDVGNFMKADLTLPSPRKVSNRTAFLEFVQEAISLASKNGIAAINDAPLTKEEKRIAKNNLSHYADKTRRTISDSLRAAF